MKTLKTVQYHGGKNPLNPAGKWIAGILPWDYKTAYIEPFAGMLGVLIQRQPVINEVVNDLNGDITNWWLQVRDNEKELARLIALTPRSRRIFKQAWKDLKIDGGKNLSPIHRALALYIIVTQSMMHGANDKQWVPTFKPHRMAVWVEDEIAGLANRLRYVYIENRDALEILERTTKQESAVIYCDPPYYSASNRPYGKGVDGTDWQQMEKLLKAQKGRVAVSGYGEEWDCLGWKRHELTKAYTILRKREREPQERTEVLWCNFEVERKQLVLEL